MPRYQFKLRDGEGGVADPEGVELRDNPTAVGYAATVAHELMHQAESKTRHWLLEVYSEDGLLFRLPFVRIDDTIAHVPAQIRDQFEQFCARKREWAEMVHQARLTVAQSRALVARARGKPHLVTHRFGQPV